MSIVKSEKNMPFAQLHRGSPFATTMTLYTRSEMKEDPKEYLFYKTNNHRATTIDKKVVVHMLPDQQVTLCSIINK